MAHSAQGLTRALTPSPHATQPTQECTVCSSVAHKALVFHCEWLALYWPQAGVGDIGALDTLRETDLLPRLGMWCGTLGGQRGLSLWGGGLCDELAPMHTVHHFIWYWGCFGKGFCSVCVGGSVWEGTPCCTLYWGFV